MFNKRKTISNLSENIFIERREVSLPVYEYKEVMDKHLSDEMTPKEETLVNGLIQEQMRTLLYSLIIVIEKFSYVEKVGNLKFDGVEDAKKYCFGILSNRASWRTSYALYGEDLGGSLPSTSNHESFPRVNDAVEELFYNEGKIVQHVLSNEDLQHGKVLSREIVWKAILAIFKRNLALLKFKIERLLITNQIKEVLNGA